MKLTDFEYAGEKLSTHNCMVCTFDGGGQDTVSLGNNVTFTSVRNNNSYIQHKVSTSYDDMYSITFNISKMNCKNKNDYEFTDQEIRSLMKWLNRKSYEKFKPIYNKVYDGTYFKGSFNVQAVTFAGSTIGFELTFTTNAPYGFAEKEKITSSLTANGSINIKSDSDEIGYLYPSMKITCKSAGKLTISNSADSKYTVINNCSNGEVITFNGESKVITSSSHTALSNDFNYIYPKIITKYDSDVNKFTFSLPCSVEIDYSPIRKVGVM